MSKEKYETFILWHGEEVLTKQEWKNFQQGDTMFGNNSAPEELKRWPAEKKQDAYSELNKHKCTYKKHGRRDNKLYSIEEYALEDAFCDEDGDFLFSVSYDLADTDPEDSYRSLQQ